MLHLNMNDKKDKAEAERLYTQYTAGRKESLKNIYGKALSGRLRTGPFGQGIWRPYIFWQEEFKKSLTIS